MEMSDSLHPQLGALYRDHATEQPTAQLDAAILAVARRRLWWRRNGWKSAGVACLALIAIAATIFRIEPQAEKPATEQTSARTYLLGDSNSARATRALLTLRPERSAMSSSPSPNFQKEYLR